MCNKNVKIVDSVPEGWKLLHLSEVCQLICRGISPKYNEKGVSTVINQKCIRNMQVDMSFSRRQEKPFPNELQLQNGDVVICSTGDGTLGRVGQINGDLPNTTFDSHVTLVRASECIGLNYIGRFLSGQEAYFVNMGNGSTNQKELSRSTIQELKVLVPTIDVRKKFEKNVQQYRNKLSVCNKQITLLREARDKLLPKLISGEIEV